MSTDDPLDLDRVDQEIRINEFKEEARELAGDDMHVWESPDCPPGIAEAFWSNVVAFEKAPRSCDFLRLEEMGVALPPPENVSEAELPSKVREIFEVLAGVNTFFIHTDHYSDRELYTHLWKDTHCAKSPYSCRPKPATPAPTTWSVAAARRTLTPGSNTTPKQETRGQSAKDFPEDVLPPHKSAQPYRQGPASAQASERSRHLAIVNS